LKRFTVEIDETILGLVRQHPFYSSLADAEIIEVMVKDWLFCFCGIEEEEEFNLNVKEASSS